MNIRNFIDNGKLFDASVLVKKTVMVLGTLGIGKSTVLNKLSMSESEPFKAEF